MSNDKNFGTGTTGGNSRWSNPVHGVDSQGNDVTMSQGIAPSNKGETLLSDGHVSSASDFWGSTGDKGHDHYGSGKGPGNNGTERGKYTGYGSK